VANIQLAINHGTTHARLTPADFSVHRSGAGHIFCLEIAVLSRKARRFYVENLLLIYSAREQCFANARPTLERIFPLPNLVKFISKNC
jgi:hypothetical protein